MAQENVRWMARPFAEAGALPMPVTLGAKPEHDFNEPIGLLGDCHRRIERFLDILLKVAAGEQGRALSPEHRVALEAALRYFAVAAPKHTADEEQSLFPRLRASGDPRAQAALQRVQALEADHRRADAGHAQVERLGRQWLERNRLEEAEARQLVEQLVALKELYRHHLQVEDQEVFPVASAVLDVVEIDLIGREMAERRGLRAGHAPSGASQ
jgi:hemerythrin-like domain-containing protein